MPECEIECLHGLLAVFAVLRLPMQHSGRFSDSESDGASSASADEDATMVKLQTAKSASNARTARPQNEERTGSQQLSFSTCGPHRLMRPKERGNSRQEPFAPPPPPNKSFEFVLQIVLLRVSLY